MQSLLVDHLSMGTGSYELFGTRYYNNNETMDI